MRTLRLACTDEEAGTSYYKSQVRDRGVDPLRWPVSI